MHFRVGADCNAVAFSPDGRRLAISDYSGRITFWDASSGQEVLVLRGRGGAIRSLIFSQDGRQLVSATADRIDIWSAVKDDD